MTQTRYIWVRHRNVYHIVSRLRLREEVAGGANYYRCVTRCGRKWKKNYWICHSIEAFQVTEVTQPCKRCLAFVKYQSDHVLQPASASSNEASDAAPSKLDKTDLRIKSLKHQLAFLVELMSICEVRLRTLNKPPNNEERKRLESQLQSIRDKTEQLSSKLRA
jgi:hypothetical protein